MLKIPGGWRNLDVVNTRTGERHQLKFRITGFGARYRSKPLAFAIYPDPEKVFSHHRLWTDSSWVNAPSPCQYAGMGMFYGDGSYSFFWKVPDQDVTCVKTATANLEELYYEGVNIAYELITPDPLNMSQGVYTSLTGITYSISPGGDFDFGDTMIPNTSMLRFNFELDVLHMLQVRFPQGYERLALVPQGGWQQWIHRGRRPEKLFANQDFNLWASSKFAMRLQCQYQAKDGHCGIQNSAGDLVSVSTSVTVPPGLSATGGRQPLSTSKDAIFHPSSIVENAKATLHFEVDKNSVEQMTRYAGSLYSGTVTVVWEGDI
ncbi:hypothetical protein MXL15_09310 [Pseudomonas mosselii]|uniref:hypothetical protein n=1 Tax=Pseudomonas mosselii TaxID=78327 RepID=UPI002DB594CE|nr:hypothetical protein [Pseudomonas mosselii]MEB5932396.1 hypothetical protein [Pseudomonas mosselii]